MVASIAMVLALVAACGGAPGRSATPPASQTIEKLIASLRSDDPRAAYEMMSEEARAEMPFQAFAAQWRFSARERADRARALEEGLKGATSTGERARVIYPDGRSAYVVREAGRWRVESAMVSQVHAGQPRDAIKIFADALARRDYEGALRILTTRRRDGIGSQVDSFVTSLLQELTSPDSSLEMIDEDRAELRWDDGGQRYRIVLRREGDEWRIDDIYLRAIPVKTDGAKDTEQ